MYTYLPDVCVPASQQLLIQSFAARFGLWEVSLPHEDKCRRKIDCRQGSGPIHHKQAVDIRWTRKSLLACTHTQNIYSCTQHVNFKLSEIVSVKVSGLCSLSLYCRSYEFYSVFLSCPDIQFNRIPLLRVSCFQF